MPPISTTPQRQIRALYDKETITFYQAYSAEIAIPAVKEQKLSASDKYSYTRMTWVKPSWAWMMYRCGYSFKDKGQERVLALRMKHEDFAKLLSHASVTSHDYHSPMEKEAREKAVRVQWDPERSPNLGVHPYRSIQVGISGKLNQKWVEEWVVDIEDVTERARELKRVIDEKNGVTEDELVRRGLMPVEKVYEVEECLKGSLKMDD